MTVHPCRTGGGSGSSSATPRTCTVRLRPGIPSLRSVQVVREIEHSFRGACDCGDFRLVHYALLSNHAHLVVEAADAPALARGMKAIGARLARAVNRACGRRRRRTARALSPPLAPHAARGPTRPRLRTPQRAPSCVPRWARVGHRSRLIRTLVRRLEAAASRRGTAARRRPGGATAHLVVALRLAASRADRSRRSSGTAARARIVVRPAAEPAWPPQQCAGACERSSEGLALTSRTIARYFSSSFAHRWRGESPVVAFSVLKLLGIACNTVLVAPMVVAASIRRPLGLRLSRLWVRVNLRLCGVRVHARREARSTRRRRTSSCRTTRATSTSSPWWPRCPSSSCAGWRRRSSRACPMFGWALAHAGHIIIDRSESRAGHDQPARRRGEDGRGLSVMIFPEGTRGSGRRLAAAVQEREDSCSRIETGLPIVPLVVAGSSRAILSRRGWQVARRRHRGRGRRADPGGRARRATSSWPACASILDAARAAHAQPARGAAAARGGPLMDGTRLRIIPLGGLGEIGLNLMLLEYGDTAIAVDCGVMFPDEQMLGVDVVIPDLTYLRSARRALQGDLPDPRPRGPHRRAALRARARCRRPGLRHAAHARLRARRGSREHELPPTLAALRERARPASARSPSSRSR